MSNEMQRDDALFEELSKSKKKRKRKILLTVLIVVLVLAVVLIVVVSSLQRRVREQFAMSDDEILTYEAATGTLHTVVSGSGTLEYVDLESLTVPAGVEIEDVEVEFNDTVAQGDILATVNMATVMQALSDTQAAIDELDDQIADAESDKVSSTIAAGVSGRVKYIYAEKGTDVTSCMAENGALAVLSLDGYMAVDIETDALIAGDSVSVILSDGTTQDGAVEKVVGTTATILVTDNGPKYDEEVTVMNAEASEVGSGKLYIHSPLRVTGYAGTVSNISAKENQQVYSYSTLFTLTDTSYSTNYESLLRQRNEQEEILLELLTIYQDGAVLAPYDGLVSSVEYDEETVDTTVENSLLTLTPNESVQVTISISESNILSLEVGQEASITVSSVGDDSYTGTVTEVSKTASSSSGVTLYSAVVEFPKAEGMLPGMTASVDVQIQGVEEAILVPVDAVHQTSAITYVYTSYDEETQQYGSMVEVTTGLWGDDYVEITSGLNVGDTVYYTKAETFSFGFGNFGGMGNMGGKGGSGNMSGFGDVSSVMPAMPGGDSSSGGRGQMPGGNFGGSRG